ncbi:hypothetical protein CYMTET_35606 [Cymbomonas tetramitiformis]|uniref:RING-type domain-containing protein n=1 Tax=Cymbomonas tetramitiformis TaxID=36881 RepID=A0AAE0F8S0_9CHLO|nr:hypothetical protein CYMTET_35606 [Cymbomonas tetramitiformis]|eukprot:gene14-20_t
MAKIACEGNCSYDFDKTYDGSNCFCEPCENAEFCGQRWISPAYLEIHNGRCMNCAIMGHSGLEFRDAVPGEACAVCLEDGGRLMRFPVKDCQHWFCIGCTRMLVYGDECRYHLDPRMFGCPPCPNECENPVRGIQCGCDDYDTVIEAWRKQEPLGMLCDYEGPCNQGYIEWNEAETHSINAGGPAGSVIGKGECPVCKRSNSAGK